jgi:hypothetical protein
MSNVTRYAPGVEAPLGALSHGDIILTHRSAFFSRLIAFGQSLRFRGARRPYAHWSHVAVVVGDRGELVEALGKGVQETNISEYAQVEYHHVHIDALATDREEMRRFAARCVGRRYNWLEIPSLGLTLLTGAKFAFGNPGTLICSALGAQMLCRGDYIFDRDPNTMMPADIAEHLGATP